MSTSIPDPNTSGRLNPSINRQAASMNIDHIDLEEQVSAGENRAEADYKAVKSGRTFSSDSSTSASENLESTSFASSSSPSPNFRADSPTLVAPDPASIAARQLAKKQQLYSDPKQLESEYHQAFQSALNANALNLTPTQQALAVRKHNEPTAKIDAQVLPLVEELNSQALAAVWKKQQKFQVAPNWIPSDHTNLGYVVASYNSFARALNMKGATRTPAFTKEEVATMQAAYFHPENASPEALELLQREGISEQASQLLSQEGLELPPGVSPESSLYDDQLTDSYHVNYDQALQAYLGKSNLNEKQKAQQKNQLEYQHYNSTANYQNSSELAQINASLEAAALAQTRQQYFLSKDWMPGENSPSDRDYAAPFQGEWQSNNEMLLQAYVDTHSLSAQDIAQLRQAMADPNLEGGSYPQSIIATVQELRLQAAQSVRNQHNLPLNWEPNVAPILTGNRLSLELCQLAEEASNTTQTLVKELAPALLTINIYDFFAMIKATVSAAQECSFAQQIADTEQHTAINTGKKDVRLQQIEQQAKESKEIERQQAEYESAKADAESKGQKMLGIAIGAFALAVVVLVSAVAEAVTFGGATPLVAIAGAALGAALPELIAAVVAGIYMGSAIEQNETGKGFMDGLTDALANLPLGWKICLAFVLAVIVVAAPSAGANTLSKAGVLLGATVKQVFPMIAGPLIADMFNALLDLIPGRDDTATKISSGILSGLLCMAFMYAAKSPPNRSLGDYATKGFKTVTEPMINALNKTLKSIGDWEKSLSTTAKVAYAATVGAIVQIIKLLMKLLIGLLMQCSSLEGFGNTVERSFSSGASVGANLATAKQHKAQAELIMSKVFAQMQTTVYDDLSSAMTKLADAILTLQKNNIKAPRELAEFITTMFKQYSRELGRLENAI